jgi:Protein of unknown function (DUF3551)
MRAQFVGFAVVIAAFSVDLPPTSAQRAKSAGPRPFCLEGGFHGGGTRDCTYHTLAQCRASARGPYGGYCIENPAIAWRALREGKPLPRPSKEWNY